MPRADDLIEPISSSNIVTNLGNLYVDKSRETYLHKNKIIKKI